MLSHDSCHSVHIILDITLHKPAAQDGFDRAEQHADWHTTSRSISALAATGEAKKSPSFILYLSVVVETNPKGTGLGVYSPPEQENLLPWVTDDPSPGCVLVTPTSQSSTAPLRATHSPPHRTSAQMGG